VSPTGSGGDSKMVPGRKLGRNKKGRTQLSWSSNRAWQKVPDMLYLDEVWGEETYEGPGATSAKGDSSPSPLG